MKVPGGVPEMRPDQALQPTSRAGTGPAPQSQVFFGRLVVISGSGPATGLFVYAGTPGPGNPPIFSITTSSTDPFGNPVPPNTVNGTTLPLIIGAITAQSETLNPGPFLLYSNTNFSAFVFTSSGTFTPTSNGTVSVGFIGAGAAGTTTVGGGGGEYAQDNDTVTGATPYTITLDATSTRATFNTKTVTAHSATSSLGGTGSTNAVHHNGGNGNGAGGGGAGAGSAGSNGAVGSGSGGAGGSAAGLFPAGGKGGNSPNGAGVAPGGGGAFGAGLPAGAAGIAVIYFTGTGGAVHLLDSIAANAGTDPVSGGAYNAGTWNYNPTFGNAAGLSGGNLSLSAASGVATIASAGGFPRAATTTDSNLYDMTEFHLVVSPAQSITATVFPNAVTGATVPVGINHYRFRCVINCTTAAVAGTPQFEFTFPSATGVMIQTYTPTAVGGNAQSNQNSFAAATSLSLAVGPTLNGHGFICVWEGDITPTVAGNLALNAITSAAADPFTVATVWLDLYPVN